MKLLFIGARLFDDVALYTKEMGINTVLTESNPNASNLKLADSFEIVPRGMAKPKEIAIKEDVDGVVPLIGIDGPLNEVAILKEDLETNYGIPVVASPLKAVEISGDKIKTKKFLRDNQIKTPEHRVINSKTEINQKFESKLDEYPMVMKQAQGQGGKDIKIALKKEDLINYLNEYPVALVENFIDGIEVSVEILRWNKKSIPLVPVYKGKTTLDCTHPLQKLKKAPLNLGSHYENENISISNLNQFIRQLATIIAEKLDLEGTADIDLIFSKTKKETYVLEINTRPSGTRYLTTASSDINPLQELVDMATGKWNVSHVKDRIKNFNSIEIPVGNYHSDRNSYKYRNFQGKNDWIIHGPPHHQRITIRGENEENTFKIAKSLNLNLEKYINY